MEKTTIFKSNRSQAVRLPKEVKLVDIVTVGRARIITPAGEGWDTDPGDLTEMDDGIGTGAWQWPFYY
ncbi:AbrB/MazE/SpoVT family DNA-binding domain-containing protein [Buttiauxella warmboldiae]|uniref:AbrB/MazE/SpoVT family DNA-binding domain-containing protein n=1 Tax=Buttiauxella warmboldiae TaxID=82993 RepID=A0A3N5E403_9ENTR|nr:AbrB/MazE/SpoVT family DNA-binding domain-containing protein [Buttiauxella warmboldiae]